MLTVDEHRATLRDVRLYTFPGSNAGRTAELMLAHKGIAYDTASLRRGGICSCFRHTRFGA